MNFTLSLEMYCGLLLIMVVMDVMSFTRNKNKAGAADKQKYTRFSAVASYLVFGTAVLFFDILPPVQALAPALVAAAIVIYVFFIKK